MRYRLLVIMVLGLTLICCTTDEPSSAKNDKPKQEVKVVKQVHPLDTLGLDYCMGKFNPRSHHDFIQIKDKHAVRKGMLLRKEVYLAFERMYDAAQKDSVDLIIRSATRNFDYQKSIWDRKWDENAGKRATTLTYQDKIDIVLSIMRYSAMPGTSRHHWGTDIDINMLNNEYFKSGKGKTVYQWLKENAGSYGFCQVYCDKVDCGRAHGYEEERWHWSYLPTANRILARSKALMSDTLMSGFEGAEVAPLVNAVDHYILGINPDCL